MEMERLTQMRLTALLLGKSAFFGLGSIDYEPPSYKLVYNP